jgi:hypothetical protein
MIESSRLASLVAGAVQMSEGTAASIQASSNGTSSASPHSPTPIWGPTKTQGWPFDAIELVSTTGQLPPPATETDIDQMLKVFVDSWDIMLRIPEFVATIGNLYFSMLALSGAYAARTRQEHRMKVSRRRRKLTMVRCCPQAMPLQTQPALVTTQAFVELALKELGRLSSDLGFECVGVAVTARWCGECLCQLGRSDEAVRLGLRVRERLERGQRERNPGVIVEFILCLSVWLGDCFRMTESRQYSERAVELAEGLGAEDKERLLPAVLVNLATAYAQEWNPAGALVHAKRAMEVRHSLCPANLASLARPGM